MKKIIKKWGDSLILRFSPDELKMFGLVEGDIIELDDMLIEKSKKRLKKK